MHPLVIARRLCGILSALDRHAGSVYSKWIEAPMADAIWYCNYFVKTIEQFVADGEELPSRVTINWLHGDVWLFEDGKAIWHAEAAYRRAA